MSHKNIVWLNGSYDVLHMGHIKLFQRARQMGLPVIVGIESDERISLLKGDCFPINDLHNRVEFLKAIKYIDGVVAFSTDDELRSIIKENSPKYMLVDGRDEGREVIGGEFIKQIIYNIKSRR
tara:strand:+ start:411 stop:779 length:369 start_codon:yes stop_codon:yes gene_type:complete